VAEDDGSAGRLEHSHHFVVSAHALPVLRDLGPSRIIVATSGVGTSMDQRVGWCVVALAIGATGCSGQSDREALGKQPASAPGAAVSAVATTEPARATATVRSRGLRATYEACIDRAAAVIPATQACIDQEADFQRSRLDAIVERLKRDQPERAAALEYQQAAWHADLESKCAWDANTEGQQQRIEANMCTLAETAKRADTLDQ